MKKIFNHIVPFIFFTGILFCITLSSCSVYKYVPEEDKLYTGSDLVLPDTLKNKKKLERNLESKIQPAPNKTLLGLKLKLMLYNAIKEPKKKRGFIYDIKHKWGQAPVLLSQTNTNSISKRMNELLFSEGYLAGVVTAETIPEKKRNARNKYTVLPGRQYIIRQIVLPSDSTPIHMAIADANNESNLKTGEYFNLSALKAERERIDLAIREKGYYYFTPDMLLFRLDTLHNGQLDVYLTIKDEAGQKALESWHIGGIAIYGNYTLESDSAMAPDQGKRSKHFTVYDKKNSYHTDLYDRVILMREGQMYTRELHNLSIERLMNLNTYRFVKTAFFPDTSTGKNLLNTRIYLSPAPKQSLKFEVSGYSKSNNYVGTEFGLNYKNINLFKGAEILEGKLSVGFDEQIGGDEGNASAFSVKAEVSLYVPKLWPNIRFKNNRNSYIARTVLTPSIEYVQRPDLYKVRSVGSSAGYLWKQGKSIEHNLKVIDIKAIDPIYTTPEFDSILAEDVTLKAAFEKQMIIGSRYTFTFNNTYRARKKLNFAFEGNLANSGNLISLFYNPEVDTPGAKKILGIPISQFIRFQADFRTYWNINRRSQVVGRMIAGAIYSFGNSRTAPYSEQFFIGGSSSIRAFRTRTLGPGSYKTTASAYEANESGEIKLELNAEYRYTVGKYVKLAAFADAGNIWLRSEPPDKPGSGLSKGDLLKEMAVGAGLGLRIDVTVLVIRFDLATPFRKPWYPSGSKWVFNEIALGDDDWRKENLILNFGIGYPF